MENQHHYQFILDNVLLKAGIVILTGAKDELDSHLITFQSRQQMLLMQMSYSSLIESLNDIIMYYKSPSISFLVDVRHSSQGFIDNFIHVIDQLERKLTRGGIKRVYIVKPERKSIQKYLVKELCQKDKDNVRINAQVVIVKTFDELYQHIKMKNLTVDFGGTLQHDHNVWFAVQKILAQYYNLASNVVTSSPVVLQRIRDLTSEDLGKSGEHKRRKRFRNIEKKKMEILRENSVTKALEDGERLHSYFQDPKLDENFHTLSKSPIFDWDKTRFQEFHAKMVAVKDSIEHAWKEGAAKMTSLATEQALYDRLIECCTWIVEKGLPYLTSLPAQCTTLAEAAKQKVNFENEFYKPVKATLKKCRQVLKEVRHYQRSLRMSSGGLQLMADNLTSLIEDLKTKTEERMEHFKKEKDFMLSLTKAEGWCDRVTDFLQKGRENTNFSPSRSNDLELFFKKHPPLASQVVRHLLDYAENIEDLELRSRARLLGNRCLELERILQARETHLVAYSGGELSSDFESHHGRNRSTHLRTTHSSTLLKDVTTKRWHEADDVMSSNDDVSMSRAGVEGRNGNDRLADIQRRLRDQELLYEQLILEKELQELTEQSGERGLTPEQGEVGGLTGRFGHESWVSMDHSTSGKTREKSSKPEPVPERQRNDRTDVGRMLGKSVNRPEKVFKTGKKAEQGNSAEFRVEHVGRRNLSPHSNRIFDVKSLEKKERSANTFEKAFKRSKVAEPQKYKSNIGNAGFELENWNGMVKSSRSCLDERRQPEDEKKAGLKTDEGGSMNFGLSTKLLDGCNSLKRFCEFGNALPQNGVHTANEEVGKTGSEKSEHFSGDAESSPCDFGIRSCDFESSLRDFKNLSRDFEPSPRDPENLSRDLRNLTRDSDEASREELVKTAREAIDHWTRIKNEQRVRLTQFIGTAATRKQIEETYFNAQVQLCRARQTLARWSKGESTLRVLSSSNEVTEYSFASAFNRPPELQSVGDQLSNGEGAFRRFDTVEESSSLSHRSGHLEEEKEVLVDNEESLWINGSTAGVEEELEGLMGAGSITAEKPEFQSEIRVQVEGSGGHVDSEEEQGSSDEFDDDVEEEELMLLCSHSSSGLLSQDELKDSLREEQERLEEMFRRQKDKLRVEREKLKEEEKRTSEWEKQKVEEQREEESLGNVDENLHSERRKEDLKIVEKSESKVLHERTELHGMQCPQHEMWLPEHDNHDTPEPSHGIPGMEHEVDQLEDDIQRSQHVIPEQEHGINEPQHEQSSLRSEQLQKLSEIEQVKYERAKPKHGILPPAHEMREPQHERSEQEHGIQLRQHDMPKSYEGEPTPGTWGEKSVTKVRSLVKSFEAKMRELNDFSKTSMKESESSGNDASDLNEICVSNLDTDGKSRNDIGQELISILQEKTTKDMVDEELEERDQDSKVGPNFPLPGMESSPVDMLHVEDDIDLMNQLIDDLIISDQETAHLENSDTVEINGDNHGIGIDRTVGDEGVSVDNLGIDVDNVGIDWSNDGGIGVSSLGIDVDNREVSMDDDRIGYDNGSLDVDRVGVNLNDDDGMNDGDLGIDVDSGTVIVDDGEIDAGNVELDVDNIGIQMDAFETNEGDLDASNDPPDVKGGIDLNIATTKVDTIGANVDNFDLKREANVDTTRLDINDPRIKGSENSPADEHETLDFDDDFGIDVDFTIDLSNDTAGLQSDDLMDLLLGHKDDFSSQGSLVDDDDQITDVKSETNDNSQVLRVTLPSTMAVEKQQLLQGSEESDEGNAISNLMLDEVSNTPEISKTQLPMKDIYKNITNLPMIEVTDDREPTGEQEHSGIQGYTQEQSRIPGGYPKDTGDSSDDDFGRVLEDIQEEESEYEDLMGYKGIDVESNRGGGQEQATFVVPSTSGLHAARLSDHNLNNENSNSSFTSSIIIDPGTGYCKAGFSIDDQPRVVMPSIVGTPRPQVRNSGRYKEHYVGEEAKGLHPVLDLHHPMKNGVVEDWDLMEKLLDEIYEELRCESDQYPVLLSEPVLNPKSNREEIIQVMFETFHVPAAYTCAQAVLSLFATGRTTGLVYDCGYSKAHSVPVYEGYALPHATTITELAGQELTLCLSRMLRDRGAPMGSQSELDIVQDIKEKLGYVVMDYDSERKAYNTGERNDVTYKMPDGQTLVVGSERFRCPEVLFTPSIVGMVTDGVHEVIYKTALKCAIDVRSSLFQNIVISGGSTMFPGFPRRLHLELSRLLGTRPPDSISIDALDDRNMLTWQGGAMLSKLSNFSSMWITTSEYEEFGPGIVHKKCV